MITSFKMKIYPISDARKIRGELPVTAMNASSESFRFLEEEPELYSQDDLKKRYV